MVNKKISVAYSSLVAVLFQEPLLATEKGKSTQPTVGVIMVTPNPSSSATTPPPVPEGQSVPQEDKQQKPEENSDEEVWVIRVLGQCFPLHYFLIIILCSRQS